ncbi:MAG: polysaccharide pyruvyl transferase CsaB [Geitlerinemataceae cyanobacterium]
MRAVLCGYYGMGNAGDEALLASLLQMLPQAVKPIVLSGDPEETYARYGVRAVPRKSLRVLPALRSADAFIWGGGSLMQDATSALNPLYYGGLMGIARGLGLRTIAWAQGIGPLRRSLTQELARRSFGGCTRISIRDGRSAKFLHEWHFPYTQAPDPVWALEGRASDRLKALDRPRVGIVLRSHPSLTPSRLDRLTRAFQLLERQTQAQLVILPFQPVSDLALAERLQLRLNSQNCEILCISDPRELKGIFRDLNLTISMRLHGLIMAAAEGCRCWAIGYDPKITALVSELSLSGWELDEIPDSPAAIAQAWKNELETGRVLSEDRRYSLADRALMHRDVLRIALGFEEAV